MREGVKCERRHAGGLLSLLCDILNLQPLRCDTAEFRARRFSKDVVGTRRKGQTLWLETR